MEETQWFTKKETFLPKILGFKIVTTRFRSVESLVPLNDLQYFGCSTLSDKSNRKFVKNT